MLTYFIGIILPHIIVIQTITTIYAIPLDDMMMQASLGSHRIVFRVSKIE